MADVVKLIKATFLAVRVQICRAMPSKLMDNLWPAAFHGRNRLILEGTPGLPAALRPTSIRDCAGGHPQTLPGGAGQSNLIPAKKQRPRTARAIRGHFGLVLAQPLKLALGWPSSSRSPMRFTVSLRIDAAANTITPSVGSTKGMTLRAVTMPAILPTRLRCLRNFACRPGAGR